MNKVLAILVACFFTISLNAQKRKLKPDVLVVGNDNAAVAAAIQAAVSGVKTTLLTDANGFFLTKNDAGIPSGIEEQFTERLQKEKVLATDKEKVNEVMSGWTDTLKNLEIIKNEVWAKAYKSGKSWTFKLADNQTTIHAKVLIMSAQPKLLQMLKQQPKIHSWQPIHYKNPLYKTSVAAGKKIAEGKNSFLSLYDLLDSTAVNLIILKDPKSYLMGQAAGATAAYAAFYNKTTTESNLKAIQGELISYKANLIPFADIKITDPNWKEIQFIGITGVLKGHQTDGQLLFEPEKTVSAEEVKQVLKNHYYKAQIWFDDYKEPQMTIQSTLEFACYVGHKSVLNAKKRVEKIWKTAYGFKTDLDYTRIITRREFAVLLQDFSPPFNVTINRKGEITR